MTSYCKRNIRGEYSVHGVLSSPNLLKWMFVRPLRLTAQAQSKFWVSWKNNRCSQLKLLACVCVCVRVCVCDVLLCFCVCVCVCVCVWCVCACMKCHSQLVNALFGPKISSSDCANRTALYGTATSLYSISQTIGKYNNLSCKVQVTQTIMKTLN